MEIIEKSVDELLAYENNTRLHSDNQINEIINSIKEFGFNNPILIDENNKLISGHGRLFAAKKLNLGVVPTITLFHLNIHQKKAYAIADNKIALNADWSIEKLKIEIDDLLSNDFPVELTGFKSDELELLFDSHLEINGLCDENELPEFKEETITKLGDVWILGNHRLLCGDSTSIDSIDILMNGEKADMVFTDPPYGIDETTDRQGAKRGKETKAGQYEKIIGDTNTTAAIDAYNLCEALKISTMIFWGANYYVHSLPETANWLVWDKRCEDRQRDVNSDAELAWIKSKYNSVRIFRHLWKGMIKASENGEGRVHPTQKPIALAEWCFNEYGKDANNVLDLFGGSGSTLIACEKTNRKCYMMELSPAYCDVIIKRWEKYTGEIAILEENKKAFKDISNG